MVALDNVGLTVRAGTIHALLGENGAGKTTLMRVAFGLLAADRGEIRVNDVPTAIGSPAAAMSSGLGMVHQHFTLVPAMTVAENVALGGHGVFDPRVAADRVRSLAASAGLTLDPEARVSTLSVAAQQRCEIVKALARDARVLILDEPTAVLAPREAADLLRWVRAFADSGRAVVLITHKLRDALAIADDVTVLRQGRVSLCVRARDTTQEQLRAAMVGDAVARSGRAVPAATARAATARATTARAATSAATLRLAHVSVTDARGAARLRDVSLDVYAGEIVGIAAVEGAGQHELLRVLAGRLPIESGHVLRPSRLGFVPEDRHRDALMLDATLTENVALRDAGTRRGVMPWHVLRSSTTALLSQRDVRAENAMSSARSLSGGNQQKLVLGRELQHAPDALVVENPSRGLDFRATDAVHTALLRARDGGAAVLVYSSDLDEVLLLADRVFAMYEGRLIETTLDRDAIGRAMLGLE